MAFAMYSKIPMPGTEWTKDHMKYSMCFFPFVGVAVGLVEYGWFLLDVQSTPDFVPVYMPNGKMLRGRLLDNQTWVPVREIATNLGRTVSWDPDTNTVKII